MIFLILILASYIIGSFPTAVWVGKIFHNIDIREHGSRNAGATNTFRVLGNKWGWIVLFVDIGKGYLAASLPFFISSLYYGFKDDATERVDLMWRIVVNVAYLVNCISFIVSVYFSHEFGHEMYEKCCMKQDKKVNECCSEMNRNRTENVGLE